MSYPLLPTKGKICLTDLNWKQHFHRLNCFLETAIFRVFFSKFKLSFLFCDLREVVKWKLTLSQAQNKMCMADPGGFISPVLQPFLKRTLDQKLSSLRSFQKHQYPSLQPQCVFSYKQQNWDACNKTGYVHSVELWILEVHLHLGVAGIGFHFYMKGETTDIALVKPERHP